MKKIIVLMTLTLLVIAAACTTPTENANRTATANSNTATETRAAVMSEAEATRLEKSVWDAIKNKDYDSFGNFLTNDMIAVGGDMVSDKQATMTTIKSFDLTDATFSDWKYVSIDKDAVLIAYTANSKFKMNGKDMEDHARCSSAWVNRDGKWLAIFHQESPVKPAQPPPAAATKPKPATSPAATAAALTTGPDAEANEKAVWEALKAKNWDAFASALAPESIEVEPDGVYDKAGSVKMVSQFDFSKSTLSDFKTVRFDADASLVTYLVKGPMAGANGERHTTIWANRAGKWQAVFHQGTPVMPAPPAAKPGASPAASPAAKTSPAPKAGASPAAKPKATR